jgi:hypothetical protein
MKLINFLENLAGKLTLNYRKGALNVETQHHFFVRITVFQSVQLIAKRSIFKKLKISPKFANFT